MFFTSCWANAPEAVDTTPEVMKTFDLYETIRMLMALIGSLCLASFVCIVTYLAIRRFFNK